MRRIFILGALGALLAGCAGRPGSGPIYDAMAMPGAEMANKLAMDRCAATPPPSFGIGVNCLVAADAAFMTAIKLRDWDLFDNYSQRVRLVVQQVEAGRITPSEGTDRFAQVRGDFTGSLDKIATQEGQRRAAAWAAYRPMPMPMQMPRQPLNCTTTQTGIFTNTNCR